jgi:hypothetical protein
MTTAPFTVACALPSRPRGRSCPAAQPTGPPQPPPPRGRVPRVSRLMALAVRCDQLVRTGSITNYAALAQLGRVSRARISQIMNLLLLAPDIQEALLFLPRTERGRDPIHLRQLQPLAALWDWRRQRTQWRALQAGSANGPQQRRSPHRQRQRRQKG